MAGDRLQPAYRPLQEEGGTHQNHRDTAIEGLQQAADQAHIMVQRQPAHEDIVGTNRKARFDSPLVGHQIAMADHHSFGCGGGA